MGPRPDGRGSQHDGNPVLAWQVGLQWVHGLTAVVHSVTPASITAGNILLQWVHGLTAVVHFVMCSGIGCSLMPLQWVHGLTAVVHDAGWEGGAAAQNGFNGSTA